MPGPFLQDLIDEKCTPVDGAEHLVKGKMPSGGAEQKTDGGTFWKMDVIMLLVYVVELCG